MRSIARLAMVLALAVAPAGAYEVVLHLAGVTGDCPLTGYSGWISLDRMTHGVALGGTSVVGRASTPAEHGVLTLYRSVDAVSPLLAARVCSGQRFSAAAVAYVETSPAVREFYRIDLKDVVVAAIEQEGDAGAGLGERIVLSYRTMQESPGGAIEWTYRGEDDGGPGKPFLAITNAPPAHLAHGVTNVVLAGTNRNVAGRMWWRHVEAEKTWSFDRSGDAWSADVAPLRDGLNTIYVNATNASGGQAWASVRLTRAAATNAPGVTITNASPVTLAYATTQAALGGTWVYDGTPALRWTNTYALTGGAITPGSNTWTATVTGLAPGPNEIYVYLEDGGGEAQAYDQVTVRRGDGSERPAVDITNAPPDALDYSVTAITVSGTNNAYVASNLWWTVQTNGETASFSAVGSAWSATVSNLSEGVNTVYVRGTNAWGEVAVDTLSVTRNGAGTGAPAVDVTNAVPIELPYAATTGTLAGTNNVHTQTNMWWVGYVGDTPTATGTFTAAGGDWSVIVTNLSVGENNVYCYGSNLWGAVASDVVTVSRAAPAAPVVVILPPATNVVPYETTGLTVSGTNNAVVASAQWWALFPGGSSGTFVSVANAWTTTVSSLALGANQVCVYGTNAEGRVAYDVLTVTRAGPTNTPVVAVTNGHVRTVGEDVAYCSLVGTNANLSGAMWWFNLATSQGAPFTPSGGQWSTSVTGLAPGPNVVYVYGTNSVGQQAWDAVTVNRAYAAGTRFVSPGGGPLEAFPYTSWDTAASRIQWAVDAGEPGDLVVVADGTYQEGTHRAAGSALETRLVLTNGVTVQSLNGPQAAVLRGDPATGVGPNATRCIFLGGGARLSGFTIEGGATLSEGDAADLRGGGVYAEGSGTISNCLLSGHAAVGEGGALALSGSARAERCALSGNVALGGGGAALAEDAVLFECVVTNNSALEAGGGVRVEGGRVEGCRIEGNAATRGGGVHVAGAGTLSRCRLLRNTAQGTGPADGGGGAWIEGPGVVENTVIASNTCGRVGGGVWHQGGGATLAHVTVADNLAPLEGGGIYGEGTLLQNSILFYNVSGAGDEIAGPGLTLDNCCVALPTPPNFGGPPFFKDRPAGDYRLSETSPCIDAAPASVATEDVDGIPRPLIGHGPGPAVSDVGAYEYASPIADTDQDGLKDGWEVDKGLNPRDGTGEEGASGDPDGDGAPNLDEQTADTHPLDADSRLKVVRIERVGDEIRVTFRGGTAARQYLARRDVLSSTNEWTIIYTGPPPTPPETTVTNAAGAAAGFYRVEAGPP